MCAAASGACARCWWATARTSSCTAARPCSPAGAVVGRVRSAAYGYTVRQTIASAYLPRELAPDTPLAVEALGRQVPAQIAEDVLYDAEHVRARS